MLAGMFAHWTAAGAGPGAPANTDTFDTNSLSSYTPYGDGPANWSISGGALIATTANQSILTRNGVSFADGEVSCVISQANDAGLVLRLYDNSQYYVAVVADDLNSASPNRIRIFKRSSSVYSQVGPTAQINFPRGTPHTFAFGIVSSDLTVKFDGVTVISVTDSAALGGTGKCGPRSGADGAFKMESFTWP